MSGLALAAGQSLSNSDLQPLSYQDITNNNPEQHRLGILDASEIPPTFAADPNQFIGLIAGGDAAIRRAQEGAEDSAALAKSDLESLNLNPDLDSLIGIAASGRTVCTGLSDIREGTRMRYGWCRVHGTLCYWELGAC
jgi:hypothetical protein